METSSIGSSQSLTSRKHKRSLSMPSKFKKSNKNSIKITNQNMFQSAGLRKIKPLILKKSNILDQGSRRQSKMEKIQTAHSVSPSLSDIFPTRSKEVLDTKINHLPSLTHCRKSHFPGLSNISINEIMHKKRENSRSFLYKKESTFSKCSTPINQMEMSQHKLLNVMERASRKNIKIPSILEYSRKMDEKVRSLFEKTLEKHFLFLNFSESSKNKLFESMTCYQVDSKAFILKEETFAEMIYFLESGLVGAVKNDFFMRHIKSGNIIGEEQILSVSSLSCDYRALEKSIVWGVRTEMIVKIMMQANEKKYVENRQFLTPIPYFSCLDESQINEICDNMSSVKFSKGTYVVKEGEVYVNFYIIKEGVALANRNNKFSHYLKKGEFFGQALAFSKGEPYSLIVDSEYLECLYINTSLFGNILGGNFENIVSYNLAELALKASELFGRLTNVEIALIVEERTLMCFRKNAEIPLGDSIYVVLDGKVYSKYEEKEILRGNLIGEQKLFDDKAYKDKIIVKEQCVVAEITRKDIEKIAGCSIKNLGERKQENKHSSVFDVCQDVIKPKLYIDFKKTMIIKILGEGMSGLVILVEYEGATFALKIVSKGWVIENKLEEYIRNEKMIQEKVNFSFITKTITTCKDDLSIYFFMEYVKGIDLFEILSQNQELNEDACKFYIGSLLLAVEYLHRKGILHRDLKPENILVDEKGYIKICDMGFCKLLMKTSQRTYTIVGTPYYMAPEMITGKGYSFPVDHYAIGVIAYVLYYGEFPFGEGLEDTYQIYNAVLNQKLKFPKKKPINEDLKSMLKKILKKNPEARLGKNCESIRYQKWFEGYPWEKLIEKSVEPPFYPSVSMSDIPGENDIIKNISLEALIQHNDINELKVLTNQMTSTFPNWDDVF